MSELPKLMLRPLLDGYTPDLARSVISTQTMAGFPRERKDSVGKAHRVTVGYLCTKSQWRYFLAFMRAYEGSPFLANLQLDDVNLQWYECRLVGDSLPFTPLGGGLFRVQLGLVARAITHEVETDITIVKIYEMTDGQIDRYFKELAELVNKDLPNAFGSLI